MTANRHPIRAVLIAGPTASGKSALALALARALGGVVVNADALQVYADLRVLTARPAVAETEAVPHALYGHVDGATAYAVGRWLADVAMAFGDVRVDATASPEPHPTHGLAGRVPIFVGGTGLYFEALTHGLAQVPDVDPVIRQRWRAAPVAGLHAELARRDPVMAARLRPSDPQRLMRALEVVESTGRSLAEWQSVTSAPLIDEATALKIVLAPDRAALDLRIAARIRRMMQDGAREEVDRLAARGLDPAAPVMKALGVAPLLAWRRGEIDEAAALARTALDTRRYAKRQSTWFRNRMTDWRHVAPDDAAAAAREELDLRGVVRPID